MENHISDFEIDNMLNKLKSNVVNWYNFTKLDSILLLGNIDICVFEYFCNKFKNVVVVTKSIDKLNDLLQLSEKSKNSFKIFDNISCVQNNKFDYVFMIDYLNCKNTNEILTEELIQIETLLNENGKILMTLKNSLGAMQIVNRTYEGLSKQRIHQIIENSNLKYFKFYYILPEIEQVNVIFSDDFLPTLNDLRRNNHFSKVKTPNGRLENELFVNVLENENSDFKTIANAYFVEISNNEVDNKVKAVFYNNIRPENFRLKTTIFENYAIKEMACEENLAHLNNIKKNIDILKKCKINLLDEYYDKKIKSNILENAQRFDDKFIELFRTDEEAAIELIEKFKNEILLKLEKVEDENTVFKKYEMDDIIKDLTFVKHGFWDLTFQNVFIKNDKLFVYDQEWYVENIPLEYIIYRSILILDALKLDEKEYLYKRLNLVKYRESFDELEKRIQKDLTNEPMRDLFANTLGAEIQDEPPKEIQASVDEKQMPVCLKECKLIKGILKVSGRFSLKLFRKTSKFLYNRIPKKIRRKIKRKIEYSNKLSKLTGIPMAQSYNLQPMKLYDKVTNKTEDVYSQITLNKTIGIHLHLYYENLAQEFYDYLTNIPYEFDLYISVNKNLNINRIKNIFKRIVNLNILEVLVLEDSDIEFAPLFVMFAKDLEKYDYIMNINSRNLLNSEVESINYRQYLLNNLLGLPERIMKCFYLMEEKNIGLVYVDSHYSIPYWSYNWTSERKLAKEVYKKIGIKYENRFLEFPTGNMFWAKKEVLKPLLDLNLTWDDFKNDKKLEDVLEKILGTVARYQNYNIAIYNENKGEFLFNEGIKNLDQYFSQNVDIITEQLMKFDVITFNIFDTLVTGKVFEENVSDKIAEEIKQMELEMFIPRLDALEVYNNLLKANKKIILISDKYLTKKQLEKILNNCGYYNYSELVISSENRKDDVIICEDFFEKYPNHDIVHVRNDEEDIRKLVELGNNVVYYMSAKKLYEQSSYYFKKENNLDEAIILGHILNKGLFNSPFALYDIENNAIVNNEYKYGYSIVGPLIFEYFRDLLNDLVNSEKNNVLLFPSREGYYLEKIYKHLIEKLNIEKLKNIENHYLYISRRAITVATIETKEDIYEIMKKDFKGNVKDLFYNRLGYKEKSLGDNEIELPRDFELVKNVIDLRFDEIMKIVKYERENYLEYIDELVENRENKKLISLGYIENNQYYLSKLLNQEIEGKYLEINEGEQFSLLKAFFTAPQGQFQYFEKAEGFVKPIFNYDDNSEKLSYFEKIYDAVIEYIDDILKIFEYKIFDIKFDREVLINMYQSFCKENNKLDVHMKNFFNI